ncbi:hypothetical protein ACNOYE_02055 [Nannocystaceae bacterium ST9]
MSFEYVIKFMIGASPRSPEVLAPAYYWTAINIFNASACTDAKLHWKAARALPGLIAGPTSPWSQASLERGHGFEIDNADIDRALALGGDERKPIEHELGRLRHGKGFVVIRSEIELDIVAVYTASEGREHDLALHTERVAGRVVERKACGTRRVNLDTNTSWTLVGTPNGPTSTPATTYTHPAWAPATGGAKWIGKSSAADGVWAYERSFTIDCDDIYEVGGSMLARSDNASRYLINGVEFASITGFYPASFPAAALPLPPASLLRMGVNTLRVEITNQAGPVGVMIDGALAIRGATCGKGDKLEEQPIKEEPIRDEESLEEPVESEPRIRKELEG